MLKKAIEKEIKRYLKRNKLEISDGELERLTNEIWDSVSETIDFKIEEFFNE